MNAAAISLAAAYALSWATGSSESGTEWVTWSVFFLLAVIGGSVSILLRSRLAIQSRAAGAGLAASDGFWRQPPRRAPSIDPGLWIGTLEFEPQSPTELLKLVSVRVCIDDRGQARVADGTRTGDSQGVTAVHWAAPTQPGDGASTLRLELQGPNGITEMQLRMRREAGTWVSRSGAGRPSLCLRRVPASPRRPRPA